MAVSLKAETAAHLNTKSHEVHGCTWASGGSAMILVYGGIDLRS